MDSWPAYSERLEQFFVANNIADRKKVSMLQMVIGIKAYTLLQNIMAPENPATKEYDVIVKTLLAHLDPKPIVRAFFGGTLVEPSSSTKEISVIANR